jgi:peptidyl-prolyl cis-trans isomerase A (cyclophilin A)
VLRALAAVALAFGATFPSHTPAQEPAPAPAATDTSAAAPLPAANIVTVVIDTTLGPITVGLDQGRAPITAGNFLRYVDGKRFDDTSFYRAVRIDEAGEYGLVQGGLQGNPKKAFKPILHEAPYATGLSHVNGAISMARENPGTATADFFFVIGDLTALDGKVADNDPGYAVFGRVTAGMEVVKQILEQPRDAEKGADQGMKGQMLAQPVKILAVRRQP